MSKSVDITGFEPIGGTSKLDLEVKKTKRQEGKQNSDNSLTSCPPALCGLSKVAVVAALLGAMTFGAPAMAEDVYTVVDGTSDDYSYTTTDGVTPLYKSIIINPTGMKTSSKIDWEKSGSSVVPTSWDGTNATGTIKVTMPHNGATQDEYYTYTYTKPDTYTPTSTRIDDITTDNTDKKVFVNINTSGNGGAIYNNADKSLINILSDFIGNTITDFGGAIYNEGTISSINGDFIGNTANNYSGGAIYNGGSSAKIDSITGDFIGNTANFHGGAIFNYGGTIGTITGDFIGNTGDTGGAIYNYGTISSINGDFIGNTANSDGGGAIYNLGTISSINGDFIGNMANNHAGGAIYNFAHCTISSINGDFIGNTANNYSGGAIYNEGTISSINGDFIGNTATDFGGAIVNEYYGTISSITGDFIGNTGSFGGAIYNYFTIDTITGDFIGNTGDEGGAICNELGIIGTITGDFIGNTANEHGGAIYNYFIIDTITGDFIGNTANSDGGAISNLGTITKGITNSSFINNTATTGKGGAVFTANDLTFISDGGDTVFKGNTDSTGSNAIYMNVASNTLTFDIKNGGKTYMHDAIDGASGYTVNITGANKTADTFYLFNDIKNAGTVSIGGVGLNTINNDIHTYNFNTLNLANDFNMAVDVDLANESMDRLTATSVTGGGTVNVVGMNLKTDATKDKTSVLFADDNLKGNVTTSISEVGAGVSNPYQTAFAPVYKYDVLYNSSNGNFEFVRSGGGGSDSFNPAVLASPVAAQLGGIASQWNSYDQAFMNMDMSMLMTQQERTAMKFRNKIASLGTGSNLGTFSPNQMLEENRGAWFRPYTTFEKVGLKNGPNVSNVSYGSFFGFDSDLIELKKGWEAVYTGYAGYNGSHQAYDGVSIYQNGGQLGATGIFYKGNFFTGLTANVGASNAEASTMYGQDNFTMLSTGIASKTGYNWELKEGKFIIQPSWLMSYSFVNTFDYTNAAGVRIDSDGLHAIQLVPGLKFIGNLKNGWQPYIGVQMVWNIMDDTKFKANNVDLPQMSVKPYIQYGVGVQKRWGERFTGFFQTMIRNGGRTGVALTLGFRWAIGKQSSNDSVGINKTPELPQTKITLNNKKGN